MKNQSKLAKIIALLLVTVMLMAACGQGGGSKDNSKGNNNSENSSGPDSSGTAPSAGGDQGMDSQSPSRENEERYGGNLIIATGSGSSTMDPHKSGGTTGNYQWMMNVYDTPLSIDPSGAIYGNICDYEQSEDGLTLKLTIREGVEFSDGTPVTIEDVVASLERLCANSQVYQKLFIDNVAQRTVEGSSVTYQFAEFDALALWRLTDPAACLIMKSEIIDKLGPDGILDSIEDSIGSNCYVLTKYEPDTQIVLTRNENYKAVERSCGGLAGTRHAYADTITFSVNSDAASRTAGVIAGDYSIGGVSTDMQPYAEQVGLKSYPAYNLWMPALFFNLSEEYNGDSIVQNKDFRKAVRAALDMEAIMLSVMDGKEGYYILSGTPISKDNKDYQDGIINSTEWNVHDAELAKEYLEKSGYNGETVVLLSPPSGSFYKMAVPVVGMLEEIGINVELKTVDSGSHGEMRNDNSSGYDIAMWETQAASFVPITNLNHVIGSVGGGQGWQNAGRDELVAKLQSSKVGSKESIQAWNELAALFAEEVPWIICGQKVSTTFSQADVVYDYQGLVAFYWNSYFEK